MHQTTIVSTEARKCHASGEKLSIDMASDGLGANPVDVLLASLGACIGHYVGLFLEREGVVHGSFEIDVQCEPVAGEAHLGTIHLAIRVRGANLAAAQKEALRGFVTQCRIHATLSAALRIDIVVA
jgi:uncharacterized OsmC-like protein